MKLKTLTVSQVNDYLANYIGTNPIFSNMSVGGEVFNLKKTGYGYTFLSLKDDESKLNAITYLEKFDVQEGDFITVSGKISFYKKSGTYSIIINSYEKKGQGNNYEQFKILYEKLEKLGYFKYELKKPIIKFPQKIGIITSAKGAAVKDIISVITRRYPKVSLIIYDSKMQGIDVENNVIQGINTLSDLSVDTIIISRGGGDTDDLSVFNSQLIAKAVFDCDIPIISAIGHEIDYVICDFVADMRAPTPSIAGELSVPNLQEVYDTIDNFEKSIKISYKNIINLYNSKIDSYRFLIQSNTPYKKINQKKLSLLELTSFIEQAYKDKIQSYKDRLFYISSILQENNYNNILSKGFALVEKDDVFIKTVKDLALGDKLTVRLEDGNISVVVEDIKNIIK
ncbi:exodeoxyribonuclease VII, large subunit [Peptoanaerobacter stomatis]|uniref:Exodeoxyribonuclease 7 large subunit n=1 Tax=Peptoanaerobacter stomatis TaxID=796937 RepID=J4W0L6_9FIRM|nr:exodeoxyribonuclease VII large subunit [Peptoanaerobacter stomatis]EJU19871.1 exodeoxyribonuclease VII, large subunit [Peptoanaerobacter stomatis]NWO25076.1 exodeoxyribonuclease VII large subunit [Peptostreptococcaceae bacterium oral taxon 081]